jgi:hypothetical protein
MRSSEEGIGHIGVGSCHRQGAARLHVNHDPVPGRKVWFHARRRAASLDLGGCTAFGPKTAAIPLSEVSWLIGLRYPPISPAGVSANVPYCQWDRSSGLPASIRFTQ